MVGIGTVLADDPMLTCRLENAQNPVRIICDSSLRIPLDSNIVKTAKEVPTIIACTVAKEDKGNLKKDLTIKEKIEKLQQAGCEVLPIGRTKTGVDLKELMKLLGEKGISSRHSVRGRSSLNYSALQAGIVSKVETYIAPKIFGGELAKTPVGGIGVEEPGQAFFLEKSENHTDRTRHTDGMGGGNLFTGIVEEIGKIAGIQKGAKSAVLTIQADKVLEDVHIGDSIAVNGVCLTVTSFEKNTYTADVMNETLQRSSLGSLSVGSSVNLERAMAANGRFGGHIVSETYRRNRNDHTGQKR